jgi:7,8-dihydropterin-6-yl-methyl-4-(beta-D-ribofuranosyl)aminobenzene 5'-phosphate synthase
MRTQRSKTVQWVVALLALTLFLPQGAAQAQSDAQVHALKITVLSTMLADNGTIGEWGYAALVEADGHKILFDTGGNPDTVLQNAKALKIDLSQVEDVVISHNHGDHTAGLLILRRAVMARNSAALSRVHVGAGVFESVYDAKGTDHNGLLPIKAAYEALGGHFIVHDKPVRLLAGVWFTGPVPRPNDEKNFGLGLTRRTSAGVVPDIVSEDSSLIFATPEGLVILTGCGHAGIVNIVQHAASFTGTRQVLALVGGMHLFAAKDDTIAWTATQLDAFHPRYLLAGHCTGIEATYELRRLLGLDRKHAVVSAVGSAFVLGEGIRPGQIAA